jgi:hypothetical protein
LLRIGVRETYSVRNNDDDDDDNADAIIIDWSKGKQFMRFLGKVHELTLKKVIIQKEWQPDDKTHRKFKGRLCLKKRAILPTMMLIVITWDIFIDITESCYLMECETL